MKLGRETPKVTVVRSSVQPEPEQERIAARRYVKVGDESFEAIVAGRSRIMVGAVMFSLFLAMMIARFAEISLFREGEAPRIFAAEEVVRRADIVDRNGVLLVTTLDTWSLFAEPHRVWDVDETVFALQTVLPDLDEARLHDRLSSERPFEWIARNLTPVQKQAVFELGLPGLGFRVEPQRAYLHGNLMSHALGFTDVDMKGVAGLERAFDERLLAEPDSPLRISMDVRVQYAVTDVLRATMEKFSAKAAIGIVLDVNTGEIIALANLPDYDPNHPGTFLPEERRNRAITDRYELGSTSKPFTAALALEAGVIDLEEKLPVHKPLKVGRKDIKDDHPSKEPYNIFEIIGESSNRGTVIMAQRAGKGPMVSFWSKLGLLDRVDLELHEGGKPLVPDPWRDISLATVSYGHGIAFSPMTLAQGWMPLVNGGRKITPTFVAHDQDYEPPYLQVLSEETSQSMRKILRYVATDGTGGNADVPGYAVGGKTGSADKPSPTGGYDTTRLVTNFAAVFPMDDPQYLVLVVLDEPKGLKETWNYRTAGWNAAPAAGEIIRRIGPILFETPPDRTVPDLTQANLAGETP